MKPNDCEVSTFENLWARANQGNFSSLVWEEYQGIVNTQQSGTWKAFVKPKNRDKNRSSFVPCWDHTRVISLSYDFGISNYIHANYVDGFKDKRKFICTQAPTMNTVKSFWRMLWNENSRIIVMLMNLTFDNEEQCFPYWHREENGVINIGDYTIMTKTQRTGSHIITTDLLLVNKFSGESREIRHLSYTDWTNEGIPGNPSQFYEFVRRVNEVRSAVIRRLKIHHRQLGPIVVHCTTGIGRTGIFCTTDIALFQMINTLRVSLPAVVRSIRQQRHSSVIIPEQYFFCYRVVLHFISILKKKTKMRRNKLQLPNSNEIDMMQLTD
uniref:Protein tyrosine phosphatase n=1 Tax=Glyptapanteles indiensis TaxID=92994 RepID=B7S8Y0_GLYIN|nr:protein tyrosine phosphatase [Glyptapanteles indiensis]